MAVPSVVIKSGESSRPIMDFSARLGDGETITGVVSVVITPTTSPALTAGSTTFTDTQVQVPLSSGVAGTKYVIVVTINTNIGVKVGTGFVQLQSE